jgi:hypothetical protein
VAAFHLHFLRQDKHAGGHALDYRLRAGKVQIYTVHDLRVELPTSGEFLKTNFEGPTLNEKNQGGGGITWPRFCRQRRHLQSGEGPHNAARRKHSARIVLIYVVDVHLSACSGSFMVCDGVVLPTTAPRSEPTPHSPMRPPVKIAFREAVLQRVGGLLPLLLRQCSRQEPPCP